MKMEQQTGQACIICGQEKEEGIVIVSHFICEDCESEMVRTEAEDVKYNFFINRMKKINLRMHA